MPESPLVQKQVDAFHALEKLAAERARAEAQTESGQRFDSDAAEKQLRAALAKAKKIRDTEVESTKAQHQKVRDAILDRHRAEHQAAQAEEAATRKAIADAEAEGKEAAEREREDARWQAQAFKDAATEKMSKWVIQAQADYNATEDLLHTLKEHAEPLLQEYRPFAEDPDAPVTVEPSPPSADSLAAFHEHLGAVDALLLQMKNLTLPRFLAPSQYVWPFIAVWLLVSLPTAYFLGLPIGLAVGTVAAVGLGLGLRGVLMSRAKAQVRQLYQPLRLELAEAEELDRQSREWVNGATERQTAEIEARYNKDVRAAEERYKRKVAEIEARRDRDTRQADAKYPRLLAEIQQRRDLGLSQADEKFPKRAADIDAKYQQYTTQLKERHEAEHGARRRAHEEAWNTLSGRWKGGLDEFRAAVEEINRESRSLFLDWEGDGDGWAPPTAPPPGIRFGEFELDMAKLENGTPKDERLKGLGPSKYTMPALIPFPGRGSLLIRAAEEGREKANEVLQAAMLRYLTSIPPGKVRFTIIDPVGLGENFAAFMHLADYSELLVTSRIWTETSHIDQRLADLSAHMENVIQKYLRNEFETIEDYNVHAGEVAEPFRVLVIANFPANFSEGAARRLNSIVTSGARCGVFVLMSVDIKQPLPGGIQLKDLEPHCVNLSWREGEFVWKDPDFSGFPLRLDAPPGPEKFSRILHDVGELARNANRVEVPFEFIAPKPDKYWTSDSRKGINIPLGRAGATKLQNLSLGRGTSQHVLIAGKTGSGKSTLLHALITNAALMYSPDQIELYLIDFKKGVEFKVYAAMQLPHAKVIAVESEREFGLSVLQRLDVELKYRGEKYRELGVQDLNGYRELEGVPPMPRILFIVDEFQEFFVEDDKIAQDTALLLDRMVRQGRAFGIHVHLGSQTLSGAFSLPRSTLGQMAVRIALQCSEADAHMILSEDNSAARLLTRPGEAIYNDANGMVEGNNLFQVVFLTDEKREDYLRQISELARQRHRPPVDQIVFEGNIAADPTRNPLLNPLIDAPAWPSDPKSAQAWLGDAIAIKDPTAVVFRPQSGNNLLIVGQNDEATLGILTMMMIGLAAQYSPADRRDPSGGAGARFYILDGSPVDSPNAGTLGRLKDVIPHPIREVSWRELAAVMGEIAAEVEHRREVETSDAPSIFLVIFDLQRFRDLRRSDDDFGYSSGFGEKKADPPSKLFATIMREGPAVGVHTIIWCDSLNNLNRTFDRSALREFENRILFQMSANDSSTLIDTPSASRLGPNRALFASEELGRHEKFRPYGLPPAEWLDHVKERLKSRAEALESKPLPVPPPPAPKESNDFSMPSFGSFGDFGKTDYSNGFGSSSDSSPSDGTGADAGGDGHSNGSSSREPGGLPEGFDDFASKTENPSDT